MVYKTNNTNARTVGAIALYPSDNQQGGWYFLSLLTGNIIHRYQWKSLPIGEDVIKRVHEIAIEQGQGLVAENFKYEWQPGTNFEDNYIEEHDNDNIDEIIYEETIQNQGARPPLLEMGEANTIEIYDNNETIHEEENEIDLEVRTTDNCAIHDENNDMTEKIITDTEHNEIEQHEDTVHEGEKKIHH